MLPLRLEEIRRCLPYFIGLLGQRYGWAPKPEQIPCNLLEREAWLKDHLKCSVTDLEKRGFEVVEERPIHRIVNGYE